MGASKWPDGKTTSDWYEVAGLMKEMEALGGYAITLTIQSGGSAEKPDLSLEATAVPMPGLSAEHAPSVSTKCRASQEQYVSLKGLLTFLLYQLDFAETLTTDIEDSPA